jgi:hypothetical protein
MKKNRILAPAISAEKQEADQEVEQEVEQEAKAGWGAGPPGTRAAQHSGGSEAGYEQR